MKQERIYWQQVYTCHVPEDNVDKVWIVEVIDDPTVAGAYAVRTRHGRNNGSKLRSTVLKDEWGDTYHHAFWTARAEAENRATKKTKPPRRRNWWATPKPLYRLADELLALAILATDAEKRGVEEVLVDRNGRLALQEARHA